MNKPALKLLSEIVRTHKYKRHQTVFKEGDEIKHLYIVKQGEFIMENQLRSLQAQSHQHIMPSDST